MRTTLGFVALCTMLPTAAFAQTQDTTMVPRELALALISFAGASGRGQTITVGRSPADFPRELLPPGVRILGGLFSPGGRDMPRSITVVAVSADSLPLATSTLESTLERAGWKTPAMPGAQTRGGFSSMSVLVASGGQRGSMLCRDSAMVYMTVAPRDGGGSLYHVDFTPSVHRNSPCNPDFARRMMGRQTEEMFNFPMLRPPAGAYSRGGGSCGSEDSQEQTARLETTLSATDLVAHYAAQLQTQGWTLGPRSGDSTMVMQLAKGHDDKGRNLTGILGAVVAAGSRDRTVFMRINGPTEDR